MIVSLACRNFRSLENVEIPIAELTAIVGANGSGKTSALRALSLVLGEAWPTTRSVRTPQDFTRFDTSLDLQVQVAFDPPLTHQDALSKQHEVRALSYACRPYKRKTKKADAGDLHSVFEPLGANGEAPMVASGWGAKKPDFAPLKVTNDLRDQARVLLVDHRRSVLQHLPSARGSALGRLFDTARKEFDTLDDEGESPRDRFRLAYEVAMDALRTPRVEEVERTVEETAKRMAGFMGTSAMKDVQVRFGFADPANPLNSLRLTYREGPLEIPAEELGLGIQSALVVGIFDALRRLGGPIGTLIIEEPEMYLHPQAQRYLYKLLCNMADDHECQVVYSTHSPIFADLLRFESVRLLRKKPLAMSSVGWVSDTEDHAYLAKQRKAEKLAGAFDTARSEVLFARKAILVEGHADRLAVLSVADREGYDPDAEDLAVVVCGSKTAIPFFARVCRALSIPHLILHDGDVRPVVGSESERANIERENLRAQQANAEIKGAAGDDAIVYVIEPSLEAALGIGRAAPDKPRRVAQALQDRTEAELPIQLLEAVRALFQDERAAE